MLELLFINLFSDYSLRKNQDRLVAFSVLFALTVFLVSCGSPKLYAPVLTNNQVKDRSSTTHTVRLRDTLYSIAWQEGKDYRQLAKLNNIQPPYTIYKGQKLLLVAKKVNKSRLEKPIRPRLHKAESPRIKEKVIKKALYKNKSGLKLNWQWPISVRKLEKNSVKSGVVLLGEHGELVRSSEAGKVVYAGNGLKGYGNLVIIMHDKDFLTAYGYNKQLLIKEGSVVKKGQAIAEIGLDNKKRRVLFFEMRQHGKAVSVTQYLPRIKK